MDTNRPTILIVEDDANLSRVVGIRLKAAGFDVTAARDAYQAVKFSREWKPALVIMDVRMPAGDGFRVHESLNEFPDFLAPVIYVTGYASDSDEARARKLGAVAYLRKPIDVDNLIETIKEHLNIGAPVKQET